ncbi:MAG: hypothetical protein IAF38_15140, partial [Bacteroidia bacterium]|nr:hypothetical protein [Bacteroidia bacterium]
AGFDAASLSEQKEVWNKQVFYAEKLSNYLRFRHATLEFFHYLRATGTTQSGETRKKLDEIICLHFLKNESLADSFSTKFNLYQVQVAYQFHINNTKAAAVIQEKIIKLFEEHSEFIINRPELFLTSLYNLGLILLTLLRWKETNETILKIKSLTEKYSLKNTPAWEARILTYHSDLELELHLMSGEIEKGLLLFEFLEEAFEKSNKHIEPLFKVQFQFKKTSMLFLQGNYKRASLLVHDQISDYPKTIRQDLLTTLKLLQQMIFYEMGKFDLVAYGVRNLKRQMAASGIVHGEEKIVAEYLEKLIRDPEDKTIRKELFQKMLTDLNYFISSSASFISLKFNYQAWAFRHLV